MSPLTAQKAHYYAGGTLNRASWLRDNVHTTNSLLTAEHQARIVLFDKSNPLCKFTNPADANEASLVAVPWSLVNPHLAPFHQGDSQKIFRTPDDLKEVTVEAEDARPVCVFLGLQDGDEGALPHGTDQLPVRLLYIRYSMRLTRLLRHCTERTSLLRSGREQLASIAGRSCRVRCE